MTSLIVSLLSEQPTEELEALRDKLDAEGARVAVERQQVDEALALQSRRASTSVRSTAGRPSGTRKRVLDVFARTAGPMSPAEVIAALEADGGSPSRGAVHNMIGRLVESGEVRRIGEGRYELASRNGGEVAAFPGLSENGSSEPLSPVTQTQEGDQQ
jgi:hypothetical protein